jgi:glutathione S-transferase
MPVRRYFLCFSLGRRPKPVHLKSKAQNGSRGSRKIDGGLAEVSRLLGNAEYCVAGQFSLADIAAGSALRWLDVRFPQLPWRIRHPNLAALSDRLEKRASFRDTLPYPQVIRDKVA